MKIDEIRKDLKRLEEIDSKDWLIQEEQKLWKARHTEELEAIRQRDELDTERKRIEEKYSEIMEDIWYDRPYDGASPLQDFLKVMIRVLELKEKEEL